MFNAVIIQEIRDTSTGKAYKIGDRVRVLKKKSNPNRPASEYIGTIQSINEKNVVFVIDGDIETLELEKIDKMRIAKAGENFYNTFNFDDDVNLFRVVATRKTDKSITTNILVSVSKEQAEKYCEQWGWSYDDGEHSYWLSMEPME